LKTAKDNVVQEEDGRWVLRGKDGEGKKEIILDTDVPTRFFAEWASKGTRGNESFIQKWTEENMGVRREHLRKMVQIANTTPMMIANGGTSGEMGARWTKGLRAEAAWNSCEWVLPKLSPVDQSTVTKAVEIIKGGKAIIFITGAGISTAAGSKAPIYDLRYRC
jgi:hypothetical protein